MRLWHTYLLSVLTFSTGVGCTGNEDAPEVIAPTEMRFAGSASPMAVSRGGEELAHDYKMWVAAIYHSQSNDKHDYYFTSAKEKKFDWNAYGGVWQGTDEDYYYPLSGSMDFLAYAIVNDAHKPSVTFDPASLTDSNSTFSTMTLDFGSALDGTDPVVFSDIFTRLCSLEAPVPELQFRHAMAKIVFTLRTDDNTTSGKFRLCQLTVRDVKPSGVLRVTAMPTALINGVPVGSEAVWLSLSDPQGLSVIDADTTVAPLMTTDPLTPGNMVGSPLYLPPQGGTSMDVEVEITYRYTSFTSDISPEKIMVTLPGVNWQAGCQYNYIINCKINQIDVEDNGIDVVIDSNPIDINLDEKYHGNTLIK